MSSTTIRVKDGESIIIGGLLSNDKKETSYKFPVLHKLPWLGKNSLHPMELLKEKRI